EPFEDEPIDVKSYEREPDPEEDSSEDDPSEDEEEEPLLAHVIPTAPPNQSGPRHTANTGPTQTDLPRGWLPANGAGCLTCSILGEQLDDLPLSYIETLQEEVNGLFVGSEMAQQQMDTLHIKLHEARAHIVDMHIRMGQSEAREA
ncbi:hypothetical protein Tco_1552907, partial [Tanacetum coccineum]